MDYEIPTEYRNNTPQKIVALLKPYQAQGFFQPLPFGTDFTEVELALGGALKILKRLSTESRFKLARGVLLEFLKPIPKSTYPHIERMGLLKPSSFKEKLLRKMVVYALRNNSPNFDKPKSPSLPINASETSKRVAAR